MLLPVGKFQPERTHSSSIFRYIPYVHYSPGISFLPTDMSTPPTATTTQGEPEVVKQQSQSNNSDFKILLPKDFGFIPVPRHLRYDPTKPFHFGLLLNIAFGFASTFSESPSPFFSASYWLNFDYYSCCKSLLLSAATQ